MQSRELPIINDLGLHARAAAKVVTLAQRFDAQIKLGLDDNIVDATSIMGLLMLAASRGRVVTASADGADAADALDALESLFADRFGEES